MDLSALTLTQLRYLLAIDESGSFRAAAQICSVSQPALSAQLQKLEELLGVRIFDRTRKPIVKTEAGQRIIPQARLIVQEVERLATLANHGADAVAGRFRLGIIPTIASNLLPRFVPAFCANYPDVELVIEEHPTSALLERLSQDRLDAGIAATPLSAPGIAEQPLFREPFYAYMPLGHPLLQTSAVEEGQLAGEPLWLLAEGHCFRDQVLRLCGAHRPVCTPEGATLTFEGGTFATLIGLVEAGWGLTVIPELTLAGLPAEQRRLHARPFAAPVPAREVSLIRARPYLRRNIADRLAETIVTQVARTLGPRGKLEYVLPPIPGEALCTNASLAPQRPTSTAR